MTTVLDAGGVTAFAHDRALVDGLRRRGEWPPIVPTAVLAEALTGDNRWDFHTNRLLRLCEIRPVTEIVARHAGLLRHSCKRDGISAVDAIVVAMADHAGGGVIWTTDLDDLTALACNTIHDVRPARPS